MSLLRGWNRAALLAALVLVGASPRNVLAQAAPRTGAAQDAIVAIKSIDALLDNAAYLAKAVAPTPDQADQVVQMIDQFKAAGLIEGIDRTRPIGVWAGLPEAPGGAPSVVAAVPITDFKAMLQTLAQFGINAEETKQAPGFSHQITLPDGATTVYLTSNKTYAFLSLVPQDAARLQALTPESWMPKHSGAGDLSVLLKIDRIPQEYKDLVLAQMDQQIETEKDQRPDETLPEYRGRIAGMQMMKQVVTGVMRDGTEVALDLIVDKSDQEVALELSIGGKPGTPMAQSIKGIAARASRFQPLSAGAPMAGWLSVPVPKPFRERLGQSIEESRKEALAKAKTDDDKALINLMVDALKPTILSEATDLGLAVQGPIAGAKGPKYQIVGGSQLVDGLKVEAAVREAIKKAKPENDVEITLDFAKTADGTAVHKVKGKLDDDGARSFGADAALYVAFKNDGIYVVFGEEGPQTLSKVIAAAKPATGGTPVPMELVARVAKLGSMAPDADQRATAEKAAAEIFKGGNAGKDQVRMLMRGEGDSLRLRLGIDVPALSFFSRVGAVSQQIGR